nr:MAG TPA: hypothetical protein [Caudoviricetes sp.]
MTPRSNLRRTEQRRPGNIPGLFFFYFLSCDVNVSK